MELSSKDYVPIPIHEFVNGITIPVDVHIRLGEDKFILVGKAGTQANMEQFKNYKEREVSYVWVQKKDYYKLAHQSISLAGIALTKKDLADNHKTTLVSQAARSIEHLRKLV